MSGPVAAMRAHARRLDRPAAAQWDDDALHDGVASAVDDLVAEAGLEGVAPPVVLLAIALQALGELSDAMTGAPATRLSQTLASVAGAVMASHEGRDGLADDHLADLLAILDASRREAVATSSSNKGRLA